MSPGQPSGSPRGCLVGGMVGALAIAAHGAAGGGFPDSAESALLLLVSALTGWAAGRLHRGAIAHWAVLGPLALGQLAGHAVLSGLIDHPHSHTAVPQFDPYLPTGWMLLAHLVATFGCVALILLAERLYALASSVIRAVSTAGSPLAVTRPVRWSDSILRHYRFHPNGAIGPRAPPVSA
ncbi:hypothetical protein OIE68_32280 [Nocardia vinacea]|uniref:hypothetical protein n=1 Tax=Nocardia vinacea TaxID=96468 RepID=UPI002E1470CD|nr:hypothetical protein OIE68_32280 [Nocardia vinacea]